jgi:hypothetical protein
MSMDGFSRECNQTAAARNVRYDKKRRNLAAMWDVEIERERASATLMKEGEVCERRRSGSRRKKSLVRMIHRSV